MGNNSDKNGSVDPGQLVAGQMLAQQREKLGVDIVECADTLKLSVSKVKALESGDDSPFTSEIFIRGYLKNYAKLLNLPVNDILYYYDSQKQQVEGEEIEQARQQSAKKTRWWLPYFIGLLIVAAWFVVSDYLDSQNQLALQSDPSTETVSEATSSENSLVLVTPTVERIAQPETLQPTAPSEQESSATIELNNTQELPVQTATAEQPIIEALGREAISDSISDAGELPNDEPAVEAETAASAAATPEEQGAQFATRSSTGEPDSLDTLSFTFEEACWVEVVDASNSRIVSSLREAGSKLSVTGKAPFSIILGNINGASLQFNGESVELGNSPDGRTLRLTVGS